jgi:hypothetical protein
VRALDRTLVSKEVRHGRKDLSVLRANDAED